MSDFTGNSSGLQQRRLLSKRIFLLARQVMNCKVDTVVVSETITDFNDQVSTAVIANLVLSLLCDTFVHTVKSNINNSSKAVLSGAMEFCILLEVVKRIGIYSAAKSLSWSFISLQNCGFKMVSKY